ncbi:hypothetical protein [Paraburkholderia dilworthii]|uniref:hypothetical protein n=1 Tax=Paraburkholderia dilworthii TaxID=948106 RepID=UPI000485759F|nr:hypothetical protein [Paraburkholderia dilworthii]
MLKLVEVGEPLVLWSQEGRKPVELSMTDVYRAFGSDSTNLIQAIIYYYNGREEKTQSSAMRVLIDFGRLSQGLCNLTLPITSKEWQEFIINLYDKWLNRTHLSLKSRVDTWNFLRFSLERLRDAEDIIPLDVEFPRPSIRTALDEADEYKQRLLGDPKFKPFETPTKKY